MARLADAEELSCAWRALKGGPDDRGGWRTIPIAADLPVRVLAGRHFPGNEEALLMGFSTKQLPSATRLPEGRGFCISLVRLPETAQDISWIALSRLGIGTVAMFAAMSADVMSAIATLEDSQPDRVAQAFLARVTAWQHFMERSSAILSIEAELGLIGELFILRELVAAGVGPQRAVEMWKGPLGAIHDFDLSLASIEVKSTVSAGGFQARIGSFEQLEIPAGRQLFIGAIRLQQSAGGSNLPDLIESTRALFADHVFAAGLFEARMIHAGYLSAQSDRYERRLICVEQRLIEVTDSFPRIVRTALPAFILRGRYDIELDGINAPTTSLNELVRSCGVLDGTG